jgi:hypothetical protein
MTLATHEAAGGLVAAVVAPLPAIGFVLAFLSHFALDAIPHWDYNISSLERNPADPLRNKVLFERGFRGDAAKVVLDCLIGLAVILLFHYLAALPLVPMLIGAAAGALPDFLQFIYFVFKAEPITSLQKFHVWMHATKRIRSALGGVVFQTSVLAIIAFLVIYCR